MAACRLLTQERAAQLLSNIDTVLTDCDGVLWQGTEALPGAAKTIAKLREMGKRIFFVTNNSTKSRLSYVEKLKNLGFEANEEEVYGTAYIAALYLKNIAKVTGKVYMVGNKEMAKELDLQGISYTGVGPDPIEGTVTDWKTLPLDPEVTTVLVGFDEHLSYMKMIKAASYLSNENVQFVATNTDERLPVGNGRVIPGTGCILAAVHTAADRDPVILGKPSKFMFEVIKERHDLDPNRTMMIGDKLTTDIMLGHNCGLTTLLVLSGVTSLEEARQMQASNSIEHQKCVPHYYLNNMGELGDIL
ncbi:glycerol-3-phosphate phosphatase-like [Branchiostoma floridae x Branchiostoma belcheri]